MHGLRMKALRIAKDALQEIYHDMGIEEDEERRPSD
jgi:hypothetical protein